MEFIKTWSTWARYIIVNNSFVKEQIFFPLAGRHQVQARAMAEVDMCTQSLVLLLG